VNIEGNQIVDNLASQEGGGLYLYAVQAAGVAPDVTLVNNIVSGNAAGTVGGGLWAGYSGVVVSMVNNTFSANTASSGGSGVSITHDATVRAINTVFWDTGGTEIDTSTGGRLAASYSDFRGGYAGDGNTNADPQFVVGDPLCNLQATSPCIGRGIDSTQVGGVWCYAPAYDFSNRPRPMPLGTPVDIGAQEEQITNPNGVADRGANVPVRFSLEQNYPNPFNPTTVVSYQLPAASQVQLVVYDLLGREVTMLVNERKGPGTYQVNFDGTGLASGVYLYRLVAGSYVESRKMLLVR
jgi:hypothetical protein